jgi:hypothetical protein
MPIIFQERLHGVSKMSGRIVVEAMQLVWKLRFSPAPARPTVETGQSLPKAG